MIAEKHNLFFYFVVPLSSLVQCDSCIIPARRHCISPNNCFVLCNLWWGGMSCQAMDLRRTYLMPVHVLIIIVMVIINMSGQRRSCSQRWFKHG